MSDIDSLGQEIIPEVPEMEPGTRSAATCLCSDVADSDGSASAEDNPNCPIHGWDEDDPTRLSQWEEDMYLYGI